MTSTTARLSQCTSIDFPAHLLPQTMLAMHNDREELFLCNHPKLPDAFEYMWNAGLHFCDPIMPILFHEFRNSCYHLKSEWNDLLRRMKCCFLDTPWVGQRFISGKTFRVELPCKRAWPFPPRTVRLSLYMLFTGSKSWLGVLVLQAYLLGAAMWGPVCSVQYPRK